MSPCTQVIDNLLQGWTALGKVENQTRVMVLPESSSTVIRLPLICRVVMWGFVRDCLWADPVSQGLLALRGALWSDSVGISSMRGKDRAELVSVAGWGGDCWGCSCQVIHSGSILSPLPISCVLMAHSRAMTKSHGIFATLILTACLTLPGRALKNPWCLLPEPPWRCGGLVGATD